MNHVTITGNLGQNPELRHTQTGRPVTNLTIGDTPRRLNPQTQQWEDHGETLWLNVTLWNNADTIAQHAKKGDRVTATGRLTSRTWENKQGEKQTRIELTADTIAIIPKPTGTTTAGAPTTNPWNNTNENEAPW